MKDLKLILKLFILLVILTGKSFINVIANFPKYIGGIDSDE